MLGLIAFTSLYPHIIYAEQIMDNIQETHENESKINSDVNEVEKEQKIDSKENLKIEDEGLNVEYNEEINKESDLHVSDSKDEVNQEEGVDDSNVDISSETNNIEVKEEVQTKEIKRRVENKANVEKKNPRAAMDTEIKKKIIDANGDGYAQVGEDLVYTIEVTNPSPDTPANNVAIRDDLLESLPAHLKYDGNLEIIPSVATTGDLTKGNFVITEIAANQTITLKYSIHVETIPPNVDKIENTVTDDGTVAGFCSVSDEGKNCSNVEIEVDPETLINKSGYDDNKNGYAEVGEVIHYTVAVTNPNNIIAAENISVRDSLLESLPTWLSYNNDFQATPAISATGSLSNGDYIIQEIPADSMVLLTYSLTVEEIPKDQKQLENLVTDTGTMVEYCGDPGVDCDTTYHKLMGDPTLTKDFTDENGNGVAEQGEKINYTLHIKNDYLAEAVDVPVRDTLLESTPNYLSFNNDINITPSVATEGSLQNGDFKIKKIPGNSEVVITYSFLVEEIPENVTEIKNIATDDGTDTCEPDTEDCDIVIIPTEGDTKINKKLEDQSGDGIAQVGEKLLYSIEVINDTDQSAYNVPIRDSLLENLPNWLIYNNDVELSPNMTATGSLETSDFILSEVKSGEKVIITYSLTVLEIPDDVALIKNIATDTGDIVDNCEKPLIGIDCGSTNIPVEPDTTIKKIVIDENNDNLVQKGEKLKYIIEVENPNQNNSAKNVQVRDSLIENTPEYLTFNNDVTIEPDVATTGSLATNDYVISEIKPGEKVKISYTMTVKYIPDNVTNIMNIVTDNGKNPDSCNEDDQEKDCDETITPVIPETIIDKTVVEASGDGFAQLDEKLIFTISVKNPNQDNSALNVPVRDDLLEDTPKWLSFNNDVSVEPNVSTTGSLTNKNFIISEIKPGETIKISYSMNLIMIPENIDSIENIATDTGEMVDVCTDDKGIDCGNTLTPIDGNTSIEKFIIDGNQNGIAEKGEKLSYTIKVKNENASVKKNIPVRDTLIENTPSWLTYNQDMKINPDNIKTTGNLETGNLILESIPGKTEVLITYSFTVNSIPNEITEIKNIVTDDGTSTCEKETDDCDEVIIPTEGDTVIKKELIDGNKNNKFELNERLNYTLEVTNPTESVAHNVAVRDSLLENTPEYLTYNDDLKMSPFVSNTGSLLAGDLVIDEIKPNQTIKITYSLTVNKVIEDVNEITNIATDNGADPVVCEKVNQEINCDETEIEKDSTVSEKPEVVDPEKPEVVDPEKPEVVDPEKPEVIDPEKPEVVDPEKPEVVDPEKPEVVDPEKPEAEIDDTGHEYKIYGPFLGMILLIMFILRKKIK